jgi:hypothetical protein
MTDTTSLAVSDLAAGRAAGRDGYVRASVDQPIWAALALGCAEGLHDLSALWHDHGQVRMALSAPAHRVRAIVTLAVQAGTYPSVGRYHAPAQRLERAMRDLYGVVPEGLPDDRPWLDHGVWPAGPKADNAYAFLPSEGEGLHQIPVGPVHAGIIEPGHFRFTANGNARGLHGNS